MNECLLTETTRALLKSIGKPAGKLTPFGGGSNHYVFSADTLDGERLIVKFPRVRETERKYQRGHRDTLFDGELSLEREAYLFGAVRAGGLPAPGVVGIYETPAGPCIIVSRSPGLNLPDYMASVGHSVSAFLNVMTGLGRDFSRLHRLRYPSFGNLMAGGRIEPCGITNFADRYLPINDRLISVCRDKGGLSDGEHTLVRNFFSDRFFAWRSRLAIDAAPATLVITDMHGGNFFVENGRPSGYFDVESAQAAPAEFELYSFRFFVFNFYGNAEFLRAEKAFFSAYYNGQQDAPDPQTDRLIDFFSACRLLELFQSYWGVHDGLRDEWGARIKSVLFDYMENDTVDYARLGALWRARDGQPTVPLIP